MSEKFSQWAIVELFGHTKISGLITEQTIGGNSFIRVDVPKLNDQQPFTKLFSQGAIYSITFVDEETATLAAKSYQEKPIDVWSIMKMIEDKKSISYNENLEDNEEDELF